MPTCDSCHASLPTGADKCPGCGSPVPKTDPPELTQAESDELVHSILLKTHLLKTRGEMDAAVDECIRALRIDPDCVEAHSLLGDIYRDQGKLDDAIRWYTLALDLQPDSEIDRARLNELSQPKPKPGIHAPEFPTISAWMRDRKIVAGLIVVILALITVIVWPWISPGSYIDEEPGTISARGGSPLAWRHKRPRIPGEVTPVAAARETALYSMLNESAALTGRQLRVVSVTIDPRDNSTTATFIGPSVNSGDLQQSIAADGLLVLKEIGARDSLAVKLTARALYALPSADGAHPEVVFVGETTRERLASTDTTASMAAFTSVWWNPSLKVDGSHTTGAADSSGQGVSTSPTTSTDTPSIVGE